MSNQVANIQHGLEKSLNPSAYEIVELKIKNFNAEQTFDIKKLLLKMEINEHLFSNAIGISIVLKDLENLYEKMQITGQEQILLTLKRKNHDWNISDKIKLTFYVNSIPLLGKGNNEKERIIEFTGITLHGLIAPLKRISRVLNDTTVNEIQKIYVEDLQVDEKNVFNNGKCISKLYGISPNMRRDNLLSWLLNISFDENNFPFVNYQKMDGSIIIASLFNLLQQDSIITLNDTKRTKYSSNTKQDYSERMKQILGMSTSIKMEKVEQGIVGSWRSNNKSFDIKTKSLFQNQYKYEEMYPIGETLEKEPIIKDFSLFSNDDNITYSALNSDNKFSANNILYKSKGMPQAALNILNNSTNLNITTHGNMNLNPGNVIKLNLQKTIDPQKDKQKMKLEDKNLSGKYLITDAVHTFEDGKYQTNIIVKRESSTI